MVKYTRCTDVIERDKYATVCEEKQAPYLYVDERRIYADIVFDGSRYEVKAGNYLWENNDKIVRGLMKKFSKTPYMVRFSTNGKLLIVLRGVLIRDVEWAASQIYDYIKRFLYKKKQ